VKRLARVALVAAAVFLQWPAKDGWSQSHPQAAVGQRAWLGVSMAPEPSERGARVAHVVRGSPAAQAGIADGDALVKVGSTVIARGADIVRAVAELAVGDSVAITFVRAGSERTVRATLAPFPSSDDRMRMDLLGAPAPAWKGIVPVRGDFPQGLGLLRGHVVLLDFWATWCVPCRFVMPRLGALQDRFGAQGLRVLGLSTEDAEDVGLYAQRAGVRYAIGVDASEETTRAYGVSGLPTLVVIDKRGVVRDILVGYDAAEYARLEALVSSLLAETDRI
jgi:thiol-disulfide isomerase/thioredoxin